MTNVYVIYAWDTRLHTYQLQADNRGKQPRFFETKEAAREYGSMMCEDNPSRYLFYEIETAEKAKKDGHY